MELNEANAITPQNSSQLLDPVDLVIVYVGGNDVDLARCDANNAEYFVEGYTKFLNLVTTLRPGVPVLCLCPDATSATCCPDEPRQRQHSRLMCELVSRAARRASKADSSVTVRVVAPRPSMNYRDPLD